MLGQSLAGVLITDAVEVPLKVTLAERLDQLVLVAEELVERADRRPGPGGHRSRGQRVVSDLVEQLAAGIQQLVDACRPAQLRGPSAQGPGPGHPTAARLDP
jgi:hypothetical protein